MKLVLDKDTLENIKLFQKLTGATVIDAVDNDDMYFVVAEGQYGLAVGKSGAKVRNAERVFKKSIKVVEYSEDRDHFIKNMIPESREISEQEGTVYVHVKSSDRARVIGRGGSRIKVFATLVKRLFEVEDMKVK